MNRVVIDDKEFVVKFGRGGRFGNATFCNILMGSLDSGESEKELVAQGVSAKHKWDRENAVVGRTWALTYALNELETEYGKKVAREVSKGVTIRRRLH